MSVEDPSLTHLAKKQYSSQASAQAGSQAHRSQAVEHTGPAAWQAAAWALMSVCAALVAIISISAYQIGAYTDDVSYIVLARSLLEADQYGLINLPGAPGATQFPFGYPLLLAPLVQLFGGATVPLRVFSLLATLGNGALLFWFWPRLTRSTSYSWALAVAGLYMFSPLVSSHARMVMSEAVFTTVCLIAILLTERIADGRSGAGGKLALGSALFFGFFIRTVGITLAPAVGLYLLARRRWKALSDLAWAGLASLALLTAVIVSTPITTANVIPIEYLASNDSLFFRQALAPFIPSLAAAPPTQEAVELPPYWDEVDPNVTYLDYLVYNLKEHFGSDIRQVVLPYGMDKLTAFSNQMGSPNLPYVLGALVSLVTALGFYRLARSHGLPLFMLFALVYFVIIFFWVWNGGRLLYPIFPQILYSFLAGLALLASWITKRLPIANPRRTANGIVLACFGVLLGASLVKTMDADRSVEHVGDLAARTEWVRANLPAGSVLLSEAPVVDFYYGDLKTSPYPLWVSSPEKLETYLRHSQATHILVAPEPKWSSAYSAAYSPISVQILPWLEDMLQQERLVEIYTGDAGWLRVFQILE